MDARIAELDLRIHEASRVRPALSWGSGFGAFVLTLEPLERVVGGDLMLLGSLATAAATWCIVELAMSRLIGYWTRLRFRLVTESELPRAEVISRRK